MAQYINKDALVAEIERLHKAHSGRYGCDEVGLNLEYLEDFIDTLEVKEMDLEHPERECENLRDDGICNFASTRLGRTMHCEKIACSRRNKARKGE